MNNRVTGPSYSRELGPACNNTSGRKLIDLSPRFKQGYRDSERKEGRHWTDTMQNVTGLTYGGQYVRYAKDSEKWRTIICESVE